MSTHAGGFTLIEVVIALAIFVVGALAIVRIFPPALGVIQNAGDRTTAANLSRDNLASFTSQPGLTPDAIFDEQYSSVGVYNDLFPGAVVGTISKNKSVPISRNEEDITGTVGAQDTTGSALGHFRRIVGERHTVLKDANGNKYILTRYPYNIVDQTAATIPNDYNARKPVEIYVEDRVNGVRVDRAGYLDFREARLASDGSQFFDQTPSAGPTFGDPRRPPNTRRGPYDPGAPFEGGVTYYVSYRYKKNVNGDPRMQGVTDEPLFFRKNDLTFQPVSNLVGATPATAEQVFQGRLAPGPNNVVIAGNVDVRFTRRIAIAAAPLPVPNRPADLPLDGEAASFRGFFHLATADPGIVAGQTVMVNYSVRDWRWMVDDAAPAQTPVARDATSTFADTDKMRTLPLRYLNDENTLPTAQATNPGPQNPNYVYSLLTYNPAAVGPNPPDSSVTKFENSGEWNGSSPSPTRIVSINSKLSQIIYRLNGPLVAPRVRTVYWTLDGWAVQPTVAARDYLPYEAARYIADPLVVDSVKRVKAETEPWREYYWVSPTGTAGPNVYFHWGDAGKTVEITYQYVESVGDPVKTATGTFTINDRDEPTPSTAFAPNGRVVAVSLSDPAGKPFVDASAKQVVGILAVRGLSVRARTAWLDNGRYTQAVTAGYRP